MGIHEAIKQRKFRNAHQKAMLNIILTGNWIDAQTRTLMSSADLTNQQFNVLRILRGSHPEPLSTLQIRDRMLDKMSDTSRIVDRLVKKELVRKKPCENDRRLIDITITPKGLSKLEHTDQFEESLDQVMAALTDEEARQLSTLLDKLRGDEEEPGSSPPVE